jgi:hypothetical protein
MNLLRSNVLQPPPTDRAVGPRMPAGRPRSNVEQCRLQCRLGTADALSVRIERPNAIVTHGGRVTRTITGRRSLGDSRRITAGEHHPERTDLPPPTPPAPPRPTYPGRVRDTQPRRYRGLTTPPDESTEVGAVPPALRRRRGLFRIRDGKLRSSSRAERGGGNHKGQYGNSAAYG